ncbi:ubiquinol:oxygen oxidoreductase [Aureococcus anophagefferens]|nr:ubiquinol:oxygen oxidoreductase [Aureococcus anophagefferens]
MWTLKILAVSLVAGKSSGFQRAPTALMAPGASVHVQRSPGRSQLTVLAAAPAEIERATMDERIFGFNKVVIDTVYDVICLLYPVTGSERDFARFYVLETVARVPYFAYLSVMHLRETFGDRDPGDSERMRTHYAEADNELHHLLIMESLGGNSSAVDRTLAQTMAFFYYWDHGPKLKGMPVPDIARKYYERDDPFLFDQFCTVKEPDGGEFTSRSRPPLESLYDVFVNIRNDEKEHWKTLCNLVQLDDTQGFPVQSTEPAPPQLAAP